MLGAQDMAFPRLNALSFWMLPVAGVCMCSSFLVGAFDAGWTNYPSLAVHGPAGQTFWVMGVQFAGASSIATAVNFLVTIVTMRAPGMTFWRMPLLVWANLATSTLVVLGTPFIAGAQFMVLFDRLFPTHFFDPAAGGNLIMYQHIFWFYSHPAVYIMMLPGFGIISEVIATHSRKPIFGYRLIALSTVAIGVLGFTVWAHHMFIAGMAPWLRVPMMFTTMLIAVPTGIKMFSWLATMWKGVIHLTTAMLFACGFLFTFAIGGLSGVFLAVLPVDINVSSSYFVVAHIHYVLFGGSVFTIYAGIYHWYPEDDRADVRRDAGQAALLDHVLCVQLHVHADALAGPRGDAAAGRRLRPQVRHRQLLHLGVGVRPGRLDADLPLQHDPLVGEGPQAPRPTRGDRSRSSGR